MNLLCSKALLTSSTEEQITVGRLLAGITTPSLSSMFDTCCTNGIAFWHFTGSSSTP
jgi:hypothetical protein